MKLILSTSLILLAVPTLTASQQVIASSVEEGTLHLIVGTPLSGMAGATADKHITVGHVQGVLEISDPSTLINIYGEVICKVYPNPTSQYLHVSLPPAGAFSYSLIGISGGIIEAGLCPSHDMEIDMAAYLPGIYLLTVDDGNQVIFTTKIIKK